MIIYFINDSLKKNLNELNYTRKWEKLFKRYSKINQRLG